MNEHFDAIYDEPHCDQCWWCAFCMGYHCKEKT
jgi:hypothetical protein